MGDAEEAIPLRERVRLALERRAAYASNSRRRVLLVLDGLDRVKNADWPALFAAAPLPRNVWLAVAYTAQGGGADAGGDGAAMRAYLRCLCDGPNEDVCVVEKTAFDNDLVCNPPLSFPIDRIFLTSFPPTHFHQHSL